MSATEQKVVFGTYQIKNGQGVVLANNVEYSITEIKKEIVQPIEANSNVKALIIRERGKKPHALLLKVMGPKMGLKDHISHLIKEAGIPGEFTKDALLEASHYEEKITDSDLAHRLDLTGEALCTIDGETAKDFDDAVFAKPKEKNIEVTVAIADVSHYVKIGTALDEEAISRGTSVYFPGNCIPMLPEHLSNGLCSLKPHVARLAIAVIFEVGPKGGIFKARIKPAVIKSAARLTYNQVEDFYKDTKNSALPKNIRNSLFYLKKAAHILRVARERRGAIDFDIVESVVALDDQGEPIAVHPQDRLDSHRIIEDLMVTTNEIVARFFQSKKLPCLYRVHEPPDQEKLENFFKTAHAFNVLKEGHQRIPTTIEPKNIQKIMSLYQQSKYKETLNTLMLRSMMQARYSEKNLKHFGLASDAYLHFTSPIRRYADLVVHRQLRYFLFEKNYQKKIPEHAMERIALLISEKEVRATELERKIDRVFAATFMVSRVGDSFDAVIVSCTEFGFFVRIIEHHVEGLVHIATIAKSHVHFVPEKMSLVVSGSNIRFMVGDKVRVKLINVNVDRGHVDFELETSAQKKTNSSDLKHYTARNRRSRNKQRSRPRQNG